MASHFSDLAFQVRLAVPYEQALDAVTAALKAEGFGVLTRVDVQATLREKLGQEFRKYAILGVCNPPLAHRALLADLSVGLMLPCNVLVYEEDGGSMVMILDPISMTDMVHNERLQPVAKEARSRLERVADALRRQ